MPTNIRIGFKTYRYLESMDLGQLTEVRTALMKEITRIQNMPATPHKAQLAAAMDRTMKRNMDVIDRCARALINTALPIPKENENGPVATDSTSPAAGQTGDAGVESH